MRSIATFAAAALVVGLAPTAADAACQKRTTGTVVGALTGGLLGHTVAGRGDRTEGALLGAAAGLGAWLGSRGSGAPSLMRGVAGAGLAAGAAGILITLLGGRLMGGSLDLLAQRFPGSRLRIDQIGAIFGEPGFGPLSHAVTACAEAMLFGGFVVGAMILARRWADIR